MGEYKTGTHIDWLVGRGLPLRFVKAYCRVWLIYRAVIRNTRHWCWRIGFWYQFPFTSSLREHRFQLKLKLKRRLRWLKRKIRFG